MLIHIHILLGGVADGFFGLPNGWDGVVDSAGMEDLAKQLEALPNVTVTTWDWGNYTEALEAIAEDSNEAKVALIGYSGGGSRATWLANASGGTTPRIDLMVCYDPSPSWQMIPLHNNVLKAICYHNLNPLMFGLGGGELTSAPIRGCYPILTRNISEQHLLVQADQSLHDATIQAVKDMAA